VKLTVNFDDPASYHLYFGDELGRPGSILTFFPWPDGRRGRQGTGQVGTVSLAIRPASLGYWVERLVQQGIKFEGPVRRFDEQVLGFSDPDGLLLELVATPRVERVAPWADGPVPAEHAVRGVHGTTIWEDGDRGTAEFLTAHMGYRAVGDEGNRLRFESAAEGVGTVVDLRRVPGFWAGATGVGTVHHVAFRAGSDEDQLEHRARIEQAGIDATPVVDRQYFHSVYFREPGGVLFEIATDAPGFTLDEPAAELGTHLKLPPMYEPMRDRIEQALPPVRLPHAAAEETR
jgi:catechol 2,3-dioxygenase-like lactoylglutathione lyase family enzyme